MHNRMESKQQTECLPPKKLLTISVAAYQVQEYLEETLASFVIPEIMNQIEVLIINDGSTDATPVIAQRYEEKYPQTFRLINKENGGHGSTINRGISEASGIYFKVVDGDDWVEQEGMLALLEYLKETTEETLPDVVANDYVWIENESRKIIRHFPTKFDSMKCKTIYDFSDVCEKVYLNMHAVTYRTQFLKEHPPCLDEHCFYVDAEYVLLPVPYIRTVAFLGKNVYMYRLGRQEQSMNLWSMQKNCSHHERVLERLLAAYDEKAGEMSKERRGYLAKGIGKISASQIKIYLSYPPSKQWKQKIVALEKRLKQNYPEIYAANSNRAVCALRKSGYLLYGAASCMLRRKQH